MRRRNAWGSSRRSVGVHPRELVAVAVTILTAAVCFAESSASPDAGLAQAAPNQSVSIDTPADGPPEGAAPLRLGRRKPALNELSEGERSTPWYRSGIGALAVVLALVGAAFCFVRRWVPSARPGDAGVMKIVGRTGLTPKQSLALVRVGRRYVMVGLSGDRLDSLCEISDPDEVAELASRTGVSRSELDGPFDTLLAGEASDYQASPMATSDSTMVERVRGVRSPGSLTALLNRLRTMQPK